VDGTMIPDYARAGGRTEHRAAHLWSAVALYSFSALDGVENSFPPNSTGKPPQNPGEEIMSDVPPDPNCGDSEPKKSVGLPIEHEVTMAWAWTG
jgi:hypothetical protein